MICNSCGGNIANHSRFCKYCGAKQGRVCPDCGEPLDDDARFCSYCGKPAPDAPAAPERRRTARTARARTVGEPPSSRPGVRERSERNASDYAGYRSASEGRASGYRTRGAEASLYPEAEPELPDEAPPAPVEPDPPLADYPAWNTFCNWKNGSLAAGNTHWHFLLSPGSAVTAALLRVSASGTEAVSVKRLPGRPSGIFWADGRLWLTESNPERHVYRIYSMDPETLACKQEADFSRFTRSYELGLPYVTQSSIFLATAGSANRQQPRVLRWNRKTAALTNHYIFKGDMDADASGFVRSAGDEYIWVSDSVDGWSKELLVDTNGKSSPLYKHPDLAPMLPLIAELNQDRLPRREDCDGAAAYADELYRFIGRNIAFIDFDARRVYLGDYTHGKRSIVKTPHDCLPFGATQRSDAERYWDAPQDYRLAQRKGGTRDGKIDFANGVFFFDGRHAAGWTCAGRNQDWCFQTPEGELINLCSFDRAQGYGALLGDWLYVYDQDRRAFGGGWHKLRLEHRVPARTRLTPQ